MAVRKAFSDGKLSNRERKHLRPDSSSSVNLRHSVFRKISSSQSDETHSRRRSVLGTRISSCGDQEHYTTAVRHFPSVLSQQMRILNEEYLSLQEELEIHQRELQNVKEHLEYLEDLRLTLSQKLEFLQSLVHKKDIECQVCPSESAAGYLGRIVNHNKLLKYFWKFVAREK